MTVSAGDEAPFVRADVAAFLGCLNALPGPRMHELPARAARRMYLASKDAPDLPVGDLMREPAAPVEAGVPVVYREAVGTIHGFIRQRRAIPSNVADVAGYLAALSTAIDEASA